MISLEHLMVIDTIEKEGSFRKASEKLYKAQSAISYAVKQVEQHYSIQLFSRESYRPTLTSEGKLVLSKIRLLLKQANEFDVFVTQMKSPVESELRVGISGLFPIERITGLLKELKGTFPHTVIHLNIENASGERLLLDDQVDIGIYGVPLQNTLVDYKKIETLTLPVFVSSKILSDNSEDMTESELRKIPQIILKSSYQSSPDFGHLDGSQKWFVTDQVTKKTLIKEGLGWGRLPLHEIGQELDNNELVQINKADVFEMPIYVAKLKNKALGPVALKIWDYFQL